MSASYAWKKMLLIALPCQICYLCWQMKVHNCLCLKNQPFLMEGNQLGQLFLRKNLKFIRQMKYPFLIWIHDREYNFLLLCCMCIRRGVTVRWGVKANWLRNSQKVTIKKFRTRINWVQESVDTHILLCFYVVTFWRRNDSGL